MRQRNILCGTLYFVSLIIIDQHYFMALNNFFFNKNFFLFFKTSHPLKGIFPGELGVPQRWYFPVSPAYWFGPRWRQKLCCRKDGSAILEESPDLDAVKTDEFFEKNPTGLKEGIKIRNLRKVHSLSRGTVSGLINFFLNILFLIF